ncbi:MAG: hypothetical protein AB7K24_26090 [Gemmataceae bacterium]
MSNNARAILLFIVMLCAAGCAEKPASSSPKQEPPLASEQQLANVRRDAESLSQAFLKKDFGRAVDLTYPLIVAELGGREKMIALISRPKGIELKGMKLGTPEGPVEAAGKWYVIYPYTMSAEVPGRRPLQTQTFHIGVSSDGGRSWTFVDGAGVKQNPAGLKQVLPDFPAQLKLPEVKFDDGA